MLVIPGLSPTPFEWFSEHLHLIGWPLIVTLVWKLRGWGDDFIATHKSLQAAVQKWDTNHLPHMEASLGNIDKNIGILVDRTK